MSQSTPPLAEGLARRVAGPAMACGGGHTEESDLEPGRGTLH